MTKKEFLNSEEPLVFIISLDPKTGKVLYDTYSFDTADGWMEDFEKDFPDMLHFRMKNPAAGKAILKQFGFKES